MIRQKIEIIVGIASNLRGQALKLIFSLVCVKVQMNAKLISIAKVQS